MRGGGTRAARRSSRSKENSRECFHCVQCHPQCVKANFDVYEEAYASEAMREKMATAVARTQTIWAAQGIAIPHPKGA